jgi:hypothetical protein
VTGRRLPAFDRMKRTPKNHRARFVSFALDKTGPESFTGASETRTLGFGHVWVTNSPSNLSGAHRFTIFVCIARPELSIQRICLMRQRVRQAPVSNRL